MGKNIEISEKIEKYINNFSFKLSPVQKEIIDYNNTLGNEKRMQVAISQCHFLHLIIKKGGLIIIDNVLWHGEVADEDSMDKFTLNIRELNEHVSTDERVEQIIIPLGDGMTVCRVL